MTLFELQFVKSIGGADKTYTVTESANQRITSRTMERTENYSRKLTLTLDNRTLVTTDNLLNAAFNGWSTGATGALAIGDRIDYYVYPTSAPTTKTRAFYGLITELSQTSSGILTVKAADYLEKYEYIQPNIILFGNYRDLEQKDTTEYVEVRTIDGCTETGIAWPPVFVGIATTDITTTREGAGGEGPEYLMATTPAADPDTYTYWSSAQQFVATGNGLIGLRYYYRSLEITVDGHIQCKIQADYNDLPSGTDLVVDEYLVGMGTHAASAPVQVDFTSATHKPILLEKGKKYWVVFTCDNTIRVTEDSGGFVAVMMKATITTLPDTYWWKLLPAGAWTEYVGTANLRLRIDFADYEEVVSEDFYQSGTTIVCKKITAITTTSGAYYDIYRGMVSFYYNTVNTQTIFARLIGFDSTMGAVTSDDLDNTYSVYQTRGKSVGECFRELADQFETGGTYAGYQHVVAHYEDSGTNYIVVGHRANTSALWFAHGFDNQGDEATRINSVSLKKTVSMRPASVIVKGKSASGTPIIVQRDDRALGTSSFKVKSKMELLTTVTDESINSIAEADKKAWQVLDSLSRDVWEGTITVAGVYPDVFDLSYGDTYGAGRVIHLHYSPLGIEGVDFHAKGIVLHENTTEIQLSNEDLLVLNALTDARGRAERSESFLAPDDPFTTVFISGFTNTVVNDATLYMELDKAEDVPITGLTRVLCTKLSNSRYNMNTYHAEFEIENGHTIDGADIVNRLELWSAPSGGAWMATYGPSTSEQFPKWRTTRVIAEVHTKIA